MPDEPLIHSPEDDGNPYAPPPLGTDALPFDAVKIERARNFSLRMLAIYGGWWTVFFIAFANKSFSLHPFQSAVFVFFFSFTLFTALLLTVAVYRLCRSLGYGHLLSLLTVMLLNISCGGMEGGVYIWIPVGAPFVVLSMTSTATDRLTEWKKSEKDFT